MAIILYNNGLIEDFKPKNLVFTEEELLSLFTEFTEVVSARVIPVLNTWCIFGKGNNVDDFNRIASEIISNKVCSHALFVHDSEINPQWNLTDDILYKSYLDFSNILKSTINEIAEKILQELQSNDEYNGNVEHLPKLTVVGTSNDKKIIFEFNPNEQSPEFFKNKEFEIFSEKTYYYISINKQDQKPFTIYADNKAIIIINEENIITYLKLLEENFKIKEEYETCNEITKILKEWENIIKPKVKRTKKEKQKKSEKG